MINLITGASGFLGKELIALLKSDSANLPLYTCALNAPAEWTHHELIDLTQKSDVKKMIFRVKPQRIYHLAGIARVSTSIPFENYFHQNTLSTQYLLESLVELGTPCDFFLASSVHVYGNQKDVVKESSEVKPEGAYGFTKYLAEETLKNFTIKHPQIRGVVGRLYSCIGPHQPSGFVTSDVCLKIKKLKETHSKQLEVGPIDAIRQFTDVRDAVKTFPELLNAKLPSRFEIFNIAASQSFEVKELILKALKIEGLDVNLNSKTDRSNPFKGLKVDTSKLTHYVAQSTFRPLESSLKDILTSI